MKSLCRRYFILCFIMLFALNVSATETAEQIMSKCINKFNSAPSVNIKFTVSHSDRKTQCEIIIAKDKYMLSSEELDVWYDGATLWSYNPNEKEVSITEPTDEELMESNPFAILSNYKKAYSARRLAGDKKEIELMANNKMLSIRKAVISFDNNYFPSKLIVTMSNGQTFTAYISSVVQGKSLPSSTFIYNKENFPANTIIDLR